MTSAQAARVSQARSVLAQLGFPAAQSSERAALVLLALLDLPPDRPWKQASNQTLWRVNVILRWLQTHYDKLYEREMVRRRVLHQFVDAGLVFYNPDDPKRPVNSSANCYQITPAALTLLRTRDDDGFAERAALYVAAKPGLS